MKPLWTLSFLLAVFLLVCIVGWLAPGGKIAIGKRIVIRVPDIQKVFEADTFQYADISDIIEMAEGFKHVDSIPNTPNAISSPEIGFDTIRANAAALKSKLRALQFPPGDSSLLVPFFNSLSELNKNSKKSVHILHYGDSQIEGDRITSFLRNKLQLQFGGNGPGLLPVVQPYAQFSQLQENSGNWSRFTRFGTRDTSIKHNRYGALGAFAMFENPNSNKRDESLKQAWLEFKPSPNAYPTAKTYSVAKLFLGNIQSVLGYEITSNNQTLDAGIVSPETGLKVIKTNISSSPHSLRYTFKSETSPEFYGISLEGDHGIYIDNIAMRGSSGLIFNKIDRNLLRKMYAELNVGMFILQFGGNIVPYIANKHSDYGNWFFKQLESIKITYPNTPIIVMGVADMSIRENGHYVSYPNLENVRDAMKDASFRAGCAYWDTYEAMGGKNSMPGWVFAKPTLASADFVHFNPIGARIIAEMFYNALMSEYNRFENQAEILIEENIPLDEN